MTSDQLLARRARRNPEAFGELFDRYALKVYRYTYNRVHHHESAEDITSQVFHDALKSIGYYKPIAPFGAWLFTIARRRIADFYKKSHPTEELSEDVAEDTQSALSGVIRKEEVDHLTTALQALSEGEREMLRLRFAADMRYKDIALLVNKSPGAVKIAIYRLLDRLKENMENADGSK